MLVTTPGSLWLLASIIAPWARALGVFGADRRGRCRREKRRQIPALRCLQLGHHGVAFGRVGGDDERKQCAHELHAYSGAAAATLTRQVRRPHGEHRFDASDNGLQKPLGSRRQPG